MTTRVLFIGLDAAEATLLEGFATQGQLPNLQRLTQQGTRYRLGNSLRTLPGAIWPEIQTGISSGRIPHYYHPRQLHTGEAIKRPLDAKDVDAETYFWVRASRAGKRVAALDIPQTVIAKDFNGIQLFEWGLHDRNFEIASEPPSILEKIKATHGDHPVDMCDTHGETEEGYQTLLDGLLQGVRSKTDVLLEHLRADKWDLFACCYGETHCVGHQFWHFQDANHPWYAEDAPAHFKTAMRDVYKSIDAGIGDLIEAAGEDAQIYVISSHGMGIYSGGPNLLPEILARMGLTSSGDAASSSTAKGLRDLQRADGRMITAVKDFVKPIVGKRVIRFLQTRTGGLHEPFEDPATRAADLPNNRCGAIRLNVKGREPMGAVAPGNEYKSVIEDIRTALMELEDPKTGTRIVDEVITAKEAFGADHHPDVPDIMVVFRDDLGVIDACESARLGRVERPVYKAILPRSGDHTVESRLWRVGPGVAEGAVVDGGNVLDVAPTILMDLDIPVAEEIDGRPLQVQSF
ncbi:MAG: alkaline phosphatase family protein [Pseudomonadota bacterium]